jgi:hypothetical protein
MRDGENRLQITGQRLSQFGARCQQPEQRMKARFRRFDALASVRADELDHAGEPRMPEVSEGCPGGILEQRLQITVV